MRNVMLVMVASLGLIVAGRSIAVAVEDKVASIDDIMKKVGKGPKSLHQVIGKQLKGETPAWDDVAKLSKDYAALSAQLGKNKPEVGTQESWTKLCKEFADDAKALDAAVAKKDKKAAIAAHGKLSKSCETCHDAHR